MTPLRHITTVPLRPISLPYCRTENIKNENSYIIKKNEIPLCKTKRPGATEETDGN